MFLLLFAHLRKMSCTQLWMKTGTAKKPKYLPIHSIRDRLKGTIPELDAILAFHALTGCDTVSFFAGHSKKTAWKTFTKEPNLISDLGSGELGESKEKKDLIDQELDKLVGMEEGKEMFQQYKDIVLAVESGVQSRQALKVCMNLIITGNPGTGKVQNKIISFLFHSIF